MNRKIISAIAWAIASCIFLWLLSLAQGKVFSAPPTYRELFHSFILFSFMLLGGGACYHFLTEIISSPLNSENMHLWERLSKNLLTLMLFLLSVPIVMLLSRDNLPIAMGWVISFFYFLASLGICAWLSTKIEPIFVSIRSNHLIYPTDNASADYDVSNKSYETSQKATDSF